jgi:HlyD family secretion protein
MNPFQHRSHASRLLTMAGCIAIVLLAACSRPDPPVYQGYAEGEYLYLAAPIGGYLGTLDTVRGSRVKTGTPLFSLASEPEQHALEEATASEHAASERARNLSEPRRPSEVAALEAQLRAAEAALQLSTTQLRQQEALAKQHFISPAHLDEARAAYDRDRAQTEATRQQLATYHLSLGRQAEMRSAEAETQAAQAQVAQRRWQVDKKTMNAPVDGEISDTYYRPGEWVPAGQPVVSLLPDDRRRIRFFVGEAVVATLHTGQTIEASCDGCKQPIAARIDFIAAQAEYTPPIIYSQRCPAHASGSACRHSHPQRLTWSSPSTCAASTRPSATSTSCAISPCK